MISDFSLGCKYARDLIALEIVGLQNNAMDRQNSEEYKAYQKFLVMIEERHGDLFQSLRSKR